MIQVPPSPTMMACVEKAEQTSTTIAISGTEAKVTSFLKNTKRHKSWRQVGVASDGENTRLLVLRGPGDVPYRDIGGLIYEAQSQQLAIVIISGPPLCRDKEK